tara:strand:+ start:202 stop:705 length:504 start_codon:yes stop_codon:yes gene_type:complete
MVRKYDRYGLNRQFKNKPCSRRDPFPRDHLPFVDDMSIRKKIHDVKKEVEKNDLDIAKESAKRGTKRKRDSEKRGTKRKREEIAAKAAILGYQARHLFKEGVGGKPISELMREDLSWFGRGVKRAFSRIGEAIGDGEMYAEELLTAAEEPLLAAGTELAELGILLLV